MKVAQCGLTNLRNDSRYRYSYKNLKETQSRKFPGQFFGKKNVEDDIFAIIEGDETTAEDIRAKLNSYHPQIQFTMEIDNNNQIPFLDILIVYRIIKSKVHRKETHIDG